MARVQIRKTNLLQVRQIRNLLQIRKRINRKRKSIRLSLLSGRIAQQPGKRNRMFLQKSPKKNPIGKMGKDIYRSLRCSSFKNKNKHAKSKSSIQRQSSLQNLRQNPSSNKKQIQSLADSRNVLGNRRPSFRNHAHYSRCRFVHRNRYG